MCLCLYNHDGRLSRLYCNELSVVCTVLGSSDLPDLLWMRILSLMECYVA